MAGFHGLMDRFLIFGGVGSWVSLFFGLVVVVFVGWWWVI